MSEPEVVLLSEQKLIESKAMADKFDKDNAYGEALKEGSIFRDAGLNPCYLFDLEENAIMVTSYENFYNKLH